MHETLPVLVGARPKLTIAREQNRQRIDQSRSNSQGRSVLSKRIGRGAKIDMDESIPIRPRSGSVGFVDTPIDMGPATTLLSPRRYSNLGAVGGEVLELIVPPQTADKEGEAVDQLYQDTMEQCYRVRDCVSTDAGEDSTSTSITMEPDYVILDKDVTTVNNPPRSDEIPEVTP